MKRFLIFVAAVIVILAMAPHGSAYTLTVTNNVPTADCSFYLHPYMVYYMAEVNFYYNAIENVKAQTAFIPSGESYTYDCGKWCPSGVTGYMYVKIVENGKTTYSQKFIIWAADNWGHHDAGLNLACQSSTFKINIVNTDIRFKCDPSYVYANNMTFTFDRQ
jgi:hypothetical protein